MSLATIVLILWIAGLAIAKHVLFPYCDECERVFLLAVSISATLILIRELYG